MKLLADVILCESKGGSGRVVGSCRPQWIFKSWIHCNIVANLAITTFTLHYNTVIFITAEQNPLTHLQFTFNLQSLTWPKFGLIIDVIHKTQPVKNQFRWASCIINLLNFFPCMQKFEQSEVNKQLRFLRPQCPQSTFHTDLLNNMQTGYMNMHINLSASLQSRREAFHLPSNSLPFHLYFMLDVQFLGVGCTFSIIAFNFIVNLRHAHVQLTVGEESAF